MTCEVTLILNSSALMASYIACKLNNQYGPKDTARSCYALLSLIHSLESLVCKWCTHTPSKLPPLIAVANRHRTLSCSKMMMPVPGIMCETDWGLPLPFSHLRIYHCAGHAWREKAWEQGYIHCTYICLCETAIAQNTQHFV